MTMFICDTCNMPPGFGCTCGRPKPSDKPLRKLAVWYGSMPESNGKTNWTAILHSGDIAEGITLDRSEYPERVRYEADRARFLIGEIDKEPFILDYDSEKHSGYVYPETQDEADAARYRFLRDYGTPMRHIRVSGNPSYIWDAPGRPSGPRLDVLIDAERGESLMIPCAACGKDCSKQPMDRRSDSVRWKCWHCGHWNHQGPFSKGKI